MEYLHQAYEILFGGSADLSTDDAVPVHYG